jgi:hypothetical protein
VSSKFSLKWKLGSSQYLIAAEMIFGGWLLKYSKDFSATEKFKS